MSVVTFTCSKSVASVISNLALKYSARRCGTTDHPTIPDTTEAWAEFQRPKDAKEFQAAVQKKFKGKGLI